MKEKSSYEEWELEEELNTFELLPFKERVRYDSFLDALKDRVYGQDRALELIAYDIYSYLAGAGKHDFIIAGPSASGKTELYRTVKNVLKSMRCEVPVLKIDVSGLTPTGYQGGESSTILEQIALAGSDGEAIVFLDEFDKVLCRGTEKNSGEWYRMLQHELLTMIEGNRSTVQNKGKIGGRQVDTAKTLFIALGAFTEYRKNNLQEASHKVIGFTAVNVITEQEESGNAQLEMCKKETYKKSTLTIQDMLKSGGMVELIGRFTSLYNFYPLDKATLCLLTEKMVKDLAVEQKIIIEITNEALDDFGKFTGSEFGCRELKRELYNTIKPCLIKAEYAIPKDTLNRDAYRKNLKINVKGVGKAELVHKKP